MNKKKLLEKLGKARELIGLMPDDVEFLSVNVDDDDNFDFIQIGDGGMRKLIDAGFVDESAINTIGDPESKYVEVSFERGGFQVFEFKARD